jgi:hypothetical protein
VISFSIAVAHRFVKLDGAAAEKFTRTAAIGGNFTINKARAVKKARKINSALT